MERKDRGACCSFVKISFLVGCMTIMPLGAYQQVAAGTTPDCDSSQEDCQQAIQKDRAKTKLQKKTISMPQAQGKKGNAPTPQPSVLVNKQAK